jgi:uncharacterized protein YlaN (UPF0358 family)
MRILIGLLALTLGACSQAPYTPAPAIAPLNFQPVKQGNKAIGKGNRAIAQKVQTVQTKLEVTRDKLDASIVLAHQQKEDNAQLDQSLADAKGALNDAITENVSLRMATYNQQNTIDAQDQTITTLANDGEAKQKLIDAQTQELTTSRAENANYKAQEKLDQRWWGLGYFIHGAKYLGWRIFILFVILAIAGFLLNMFVPALSPIFTAIIRFFVSIPGRIARFIIGLFKRPAPPS